MIRVRSAMDDEEISWKLNNWTNSLRRQSNIEPKQKSVQSLIEILAQLVSRMIDRFFV